MSVAVEGLPGIGKTELALHVAESIARRGGYPGGIYWFDAQVPDLSWTWGTAIADELGLPEMPLTQRAALAVRTVTRRDVPVLLILDNVDEWIGSTHPEPLPRCSALALLATSQHKNLGGTQFHHFTLRPLERNASARLVCSVARRSFDLSPRFDDLLDELGGHPLALEIAGAFLQEFSEVEPREYLDKLRESSAVETDVAHFVQYGTTVDAAYLPIWDRITPQARRAWQVATLFRSLPASHALGRSAGMSDDQLRVLRHFHLISSGDDAGMWQMHQLTRRFAEQRISVEQRRALVIEFLNGCLLLVADADPTSGIVKYRPDRAHLDWALEAARTSFVPADPRLYEFMSRIAQAQESIGDFATARPLMEEALSGVVSHFGSEAKLAGELRAALGWLLYEIGEYKRARDELEEAARILLLNGDETRPEVAEALSNLGWVVHALGEYSTAKDLLERALAIDLQCYSADHKEVATDRSNLGWVLKELGRLEEGRAELELALQSDILRYGEGHPVVAVRRSNLGGVLHDLDEFEAARVQMTEALRSDLESLGNEHPRVAIRRSNLAALLLDIGEVEAARELASTGLEVEIRSLGERHPLTAIRRQRLGEIFLRKGCYADAHSQLVQALDLSVSVLGEQHPTTAVIRATLALVEFSLGNRAGASSEMAIALQTASELPERGRARRKVMQAKEILDRQIGDQSRTVSPQPIK